MLEIFLLKCSSSFIGKRSRDSLDRLELQQGACGLENPLCEVLSATDNLDAAQNRRGRETNAYGNKCSLIEKRPLGLCGMHCMPRWVARLAQGELSKIGPYNYPTKLFIRKPSLECFLLHLSWLSCILNDILNADFAKKKMRLSSHKWM